MSRQMIVTPELQAYVDEVIALVCKRNGIKPADLLGRNYPNRMKPEKGTRTNPKKKTNGQPRYKSGPYAAARVDVARILRGTVGNDGWIRKAGLPVSWVFGDPTKPISFPSIGGLLGGLDHTAVIRGIAKMKEAGAPEVLTFDCYAGFGDTTMVRCPGDKRNDTTPEID